MLSNRIFIFVATFFVIVFVSLRIIQARIAPSSNTDKTDWAENLGDQVADILVLLERIGFNIDMFPANYTGIGILRLFPCPRDLPDAALNLMSDAQNQRPNATWSLGGYTCSADQFKDIPRITNGGGSSSPLVLISEEGGRDAALYRIENYVAKLEKTTRDNNINPRIIINFWMTLPDPVLFSKFGPYFAYDVLKIFMNHGFCEIVLMATQENVYEKENCEKFHRYLNDDFGPGVQIMRQNLQNTQMDRCSIHSSTVPTHSKESHFELVTQRIF